MEVAVLGILALGGYHIQKKIPDSPPNFQSNKEKSIFTNNNIYDSNKINESRHFIQQKGNDNVNKSNDPANTNIIPVNYNNNTIEKQKRMLLENSRRDNDQYIKSLEKFDSLLEPSEKQNEQKFVKEYFENINSSNKNYHVFDHKQELNNSNQQNIMLTNSLDSVFKDTKNLKHNNMVPFFGSNITQSLDKHQRHSYNINDEHYKPKREKNAPHPTKNVGLVHGSQLTRDLSQFNQSMYKPDEKPVESINVGPGLDKGYCASGNNGFHNEYRVQHKTVDELRSSSNPKKTYSSRIKSGKQLNSSRSSIQHVNRNRPETTFEQTPDNYFRTTGSYLKEKFHPLVRETPKKMESTNEYTGGAGNIPKNKLSHKEICYTESTKHEQNSAPPSNVQGSVKRGNNNQKSYNISPTIRSQTSKNNHTGNIGGQTKLTTHMQDTQKTTTRQTTQFNDYTGNISGTNKNYASYGDEAKTTVKQTTELNDYTGNLSGASKFTAHAQDEFRTTGRQTTQFNDHTGTLSGANKFTAHAQDEFRTTGRQTTQFNDHTGTLSGANKFTAHAQDEFRTTGRQTTQFNDHTGTLSGANKFTAHAQDEFRTTGRQTTQFNDHTGTLSGASKFTAHAQDEFRTTGRQTTQFNDHTGTLSGASKFTTHAQDKFRTTGRQTTEFNDHTGTLSGYNKSTSTVLDDIKTTTRELTELNDHTGTLSGHLKQEIGQLDDLKITTKQMTVEYSRDGNIKGTSKHQIGLQDDVKNTQKQDLSNNEYGGNLTGIDKSMVRLQDEARSTQKEDLSNNEYHGGVRGQNKYTIGLQDDVKETQKHDLSNHEYAGDLKGQVKYRSRIAEENAETNEKREIISQRRHNSKQGPKTSLNPKDYNLSVNRQEYDECRGDDVRYTRTMANNGEQVRFGELTINENKSFKQDRMDPSIYDAYRMNEYTIRKV